MKQDFVFTSESVTEGHPDKLCDQISDAVVDRYLAEDRFSRVVAETAVATGIVFIAIRVASRASVDVPSVARGVISRVGYDRDSFNAHSCSIMTSATELPASDYVEVDETDLDDAGLEQVPAGNLVTLFGYACTQTPALMPLPIWYAHKVARRLGEVRLTGELSYLTPDGTVQAGVEFRARRPHRLHSLSINACLDAADSPDPEQVTRDIRRRVIDAALEDEAIRPDRDTRLFINPKGSYGEGGPAAHAGLTGRKVAADTYGGFSRQASAALSGKDPSRIDRTGAYAARHAARNVVAAGLAGECEVQLSYSIGAARPVSVQVNTFGTGTVADPEIGERLRAAFDFRPAAIIRRFELRDQTTRRKGAFFSRLAAYGQVGRQDMGLPWELPDMAEALKG
ncbi:MAG: methionine adenosyltransferase [Hyphomicrobiales bacterium]|nr:methionine adenosyltransferase [Hyphomicrobiales bacterium]